MGYIYKITNKINNKCYIGQTRRNDISLRWNEHKRKSKYKDNMVIYKAFRKYGIENFIFEVLEKCSKEKLNEREIFWINKFNSNDKNYGYNSTIGGNNNSCYCYRKIEQYTLDGIYLRTFNTQVDIEKELGYDQATISACLVGKNKTAHNFQWKYIDDDKKIYKIAKGKVKKVYQYDLMGNFVKEFLSIRQAEEEMTGNKLKTCILQCCKGKHKTAYGYQWSYDKKDNVGKIELKTSNQFLVKLTAI